MGSARYDRSAQLAEAPHVVNCITFTAWVFRQCGIIIPAKLEQIECGVEIVPDDLARGDLVFSTGVQSYLQHPRYGAIGHVGFWAGNGCVIHATRRGPLNGIIEEPLGQFLRGHHGGHHDSIRAVKRLI